MMLNEGVDPVSNTTIIPIAAYKVITTASSIVFGAGKDKLTTILGYGMGWRRTAYRGNEVNVHLLVGSSYSDRSYLSWSGMVAAYQVS